MSIVSSSPLITLTFNDACLVLTVPTVCRSISVSTTISYNFNISAGAGSFKFKLAKSIESANASFNNVELIRSTAICNAAGLLINILCRGLTPIPYFCFADNLESGTLLPTASVPTRLSIHLFSKLTDGRLSATPSVNN